MSGGGCNERPARAEISITVIPSSGLGLVNEYYARVNFRSSGPGDLVVAAETEGRKAGFGRLTPVGPDSAELGGIYVLPEFRRRGIAARIVPCLLAQSSHRNLFCIPFAQLEKFYAGFGFEPVTGSYRLPPAIRQKLAWCRGTYPQAVRPMLRRGR